MTGTNVDAIPPPSPHPALAGRRVLVVDDVDAVARSTARLLEHFGAATTVAISGREALARVAAGAWDLLVIDIGLGDLDGREVVARARELHAGLPVVIASGLPAGGPFAPGVSFLPKPFALAGLLAAAEAALARR